MTNSLACDMAASSELLVRQDLLMCRGRQSVGDGAVRTRPREREGARREEQQASWND